MNLGSRLHIKMYPGQVYLSREAKNNDLCREHVKCGMATLLAWRALHAGLEKQFFPGRRLAAPVEQTTEG